MSASASNPGMPPFNLSQYSSEESDRSAGSRNFYLTRNMPSSSDEGHATVNLPQSSNFHGQDSMGFSGQSSNMSNSISSLHSNGSATASGGNGAGNGNTSVGRSGYDQASRLRLNFNNARSSSPLSRPPLFSPNLLHEVERSHQFQVRSPSGSHPASSPPPRSSLTSPRYFIEPTHSSNTSNQHFQHIQQHHHQQPQQHSQQHQYQAHQNQQNQHNSSHQNQYPPSHMQQPHGHPQQQQQQPWQPRNGAMGPLDFPPSAHGPGLNPTDRSHSSLSERSSRIHDGRNMGPGTSQSPVGGLNKDPEFSIFVGDLSPDLREEDLVAQFLQPPAWPHNHPFASALIHAQQAQGIFSPGAHIGPAPFHSTKSAKIMTDPVTGVSKGYGFVRFANEADCNRALVEMQGVVVSPANGMSPGRPLRVSTATPKNRGMAPPQMGGPNMAGDLHQQNHLQMPRPHNPAQNAGPDFLYGGAGGPRSEVVSPQPQPPHVRQQSSPSHASSLVSPVSPYDGPGGPPSFGPLYGGFPGDAHNGPRDQSPAGMLRSHTPTTLPHQTQGGNAGDSAADPNNTTVFVGGLSSLISESTLRRYFEHFGEITYVKIPPGKGCGFVQYVRKQDAENAIQRMNGFPILNSKIRLSWGRSQGDKAAAAAAQTMAQYAQLGQLAGLAGLSTLSPSQLAQLAGLGSALSAVQAQQQQQQQQGGQRGGGQFGGMTNDPLSTLARQLAAANLGGGGGGGPGMGGVNQRPPLPPFLQQQSHPQQQQQGFRNQPPAFPPQNNANGYGGSTSSHSNREFDFDHNPESELIDAFTNLDFDDSTRAALAQRLQAAGAGGRAGADPFRGAGGFNRDPNAFMFSPFSPSDSPLVGGKADLPSGSSASSLQLSHRAGGEHDEEEEES